MTILVESHYIDRDYIQDVALFYARSLRNYDNYGQRWHFFTDTISKEEWQQRFQNATPISRGEHSATLQRSYLGFTVIRPLPGSPVGRTVLQTFGPTTDSGHPRVFPTLRDYPVHLAGFTLTVRGLAFQQQDQGVSACATTALWSSLQNVARMEELHVPTPAEITQAASRYLLSASAGRASPPKGSPCNSCAKRPEQRGYTRSSYPPPRSRTTAPKSLGTSTPALHRLSNPFDRHR